MEISIQKPCHENWDSFTPNEQGAFCGKCVKTVIDFDANPLYLWAIMQDMPVGK